MSRDEYKHDLVQSLFEKEANRFLDADAVESSAVGPLNNFFDDIFLSLLFRSSDTFSQPLAAIKEHLLTVADQKQPRHIRAGAAVELGRFIAYRHPDDRFRPDSSRPEHWFGLARQLNSVVGAWELAKVLLAQQRLRIDFDLKTDPLPQLVYTGDRTLRGAAQVGPEVSEAFYLGARVALRHVQRHFSGWDKQSFGCAFACIVSYLTLLPPRRLDDYESLTAHRRKALVWIKPLWNRLINGAVEGAPDADERRAELVEQQLAVFVYLDDLDANGLPGTQSSTPAPRTMIKKPGTNQMVVVCGVIPGSSDKAEGEYLKRFESLRAPLTFKPMPDLPALDELRARLSAEFPWATAAISAIMSDLLARKRHGSTRLGLYPVLLVGPPGTGKTRFVQRLSELLGTPNTVINLAGMCDVKLLKGVTRGWSSNRSSRIVEFIQQTQVPNPLFVLDEIDKAHSAFSNGGDPQDALLDLLEPGNARRYQDIYLMTECDLSHCIYIATSNYLDAVSEPLLSRLRPVPFPAPGPEYSEVILRGILRDLESAWGLPADALTITSGQVALLRGLSAREMRRAVLELLGNDADEAVYIHH